MRSFLARHASLANHTLANRAMKAVGGLMIAVLALYGCGKDEKPLPEVKPEAVVKQFYEYISEAKIRGGHLLIREAYKLTSAEQSKLSQASFIEIINRYPSGFKAEIINSTINGRHAEVTIEYKIGSAFGGMHSVRTGIPLNVDEAASAWKIDFTGETDSQDLAAMKKADQASQAEQKQAGEK